MHSHFILTLSSHKHPLRLSYSTQWTDPAQSSTVVVVIVAVVIQATLLLHGVHFDHKSAVKFQLQCECEARGEKPKKFIQ